MTSSGELAGMVAMVGGSTQGIGLACARALAARGARLVLLARDRARLQAARATLAAAAGGGEHLVAVADHGAPDEVRAAAESALGEVGAVHILVHNTGGPPAGAAADAEPEAFALAFRQQVISGQVLVRALVPGMRSAGYGRVVNIISTSVKQPIPNLGVSNTVRAAVANWAKTLAGELGPHGITVNNVLPGYTRTERLESLVRGRAGKSGLTTEAVERELLATIPAGRFGRPEETAAAVAFLCGPDAGYINGINLPVDGGRLGCL